MGDKTASYIPQSSPQSTLVIFIVHYWGVRRDMLTNPIKAIHMKTTHGTITARTASAVNLCHI